MKDTTIAVDIAKDVFEIAVSPEPGVVTEKHRVSRKKLLSFFANRPAATVVMEACGSSHHWGREITKLGHRVVLLPPHVVRPYVQRNKSDQTDAKGILEAYRNKDIKPVPVKSIEQQSVTALHRVLSVSLTDFLRRRLVSLATQRKGVAVARRKSGKSESVQVEKARKKFVAWRRSRKARSRIPEELWTSAVVAARDIGVNQACKALRLDYYALKRRVVASPEMPSVKASGNFVEFDSGVSPLFTEWAVEMDNGSGARMRVAARSVSGPDVVALSRTFFGEES